MTAEVSIWNWKCQRYLLIRWSTLCTSCRVKLFLNPEELKSHNTCKCFQCKKQKQKQKNLVFGTSKSGWCRLLRTSKHGINLRMGVTNIQCRGGWFINYGSWDMMSNFLLVHHWCLTNFDVWWITCLKPESGLYVHIGMLLLCITHEFIISLQLPGS